MFEPLSVSMCFWKAIRVIIQLLIFWFIPFLLSFRVVNSHPTWDVEYLFTTVLILDILIQLNLAYYERG